ncbi:MAG: Crp/Fnr family transcriptional regulator [Desulfobulbaceae bacterium A2]|nr:MAG: Crp/Fnr family transcriptional regulator [Desulfobulbaceae bacterium A2]
MKEHWHLDEEGTFEGLEEERSAFFALARRRELAKNDIIFFEDDAGDTCFYLEKGLVKIFRIAPSGKEPIFFLRRAGELFGLAEVMVSERRKANAQALVPSVLYEIQRPDFDAFLAGHHRAARRIISILGSRVRYLGEQVSNLMVCDVDKRLAKLLVHLAYEHLRSEDSWEQPVTISPSLTQEQLAAMTGSCQQTISELLKEYQDEGLLQVDRRHIVVLNPLKLLEKAEL